MRGTLKQRSKGSWTVILDLGPDPATGKRRQIWRTVHGPKRDAEALLGELLHEQATGVERPVGKLTVREYLERWMRDYVTPNLAPKTAATYRDVIDNHLSPALGRVELVALRPTAIQALYTKMADKGLAPRSILRYHQILHAALHQAVRWQLLIRNPADAVEVRQADRRQIPNLTPAEVRGLMDAADAGGIGPFVRLAVLTGLRRGELLGLTWANVDLERSTLSVSQSAQRIDGQGIVFRQPKTRLSRRAVALSPDAVGVLRAHRKAQAEARLLAGPAYDDRDLVFATGLGTPLEPSNLARSWRRVRNAAGMQTLTIHDLRHAHATLMLRGGVHPKVVSERLGHASVNITLDTYSHVLPGLQEAAAAKLDAMLAEPELAEAK